MAKNTTDSSIPVLLYQDQDIIVINKPSNLLSIQDGYDPALPHLRSILEPLYGQLWMVHRLDRETSGIILLARNANAHRNLNKTFRDRKIEKKYHGLVTPVPSWTEMDINFPLKPNADRHHHTRVDTKTGKTAESKCKVLKWFSVGVLMEIQIFTGITHQIRAHLRAFDLTLLGDLNYNAGLPSQPFNVPRMMLHSRSLGFIHPTTDQWLQFMAPYPDDFRDAYEIIKTTKDQDAMI